MRVFPCFLLIAYSFNTFYGRPNLAIGRTKGKYPHDSKYLELVKQWPVVAPVIWSDFNIGIAAPYPRESIARDFHYRQHHLVPESYLLHSGSNHDDRLGT